MYCQFVNDEFAWESGVCQPCITSDSTNQDFLCLDRIDALNPVQACGTTGTCSQGFVKPAQTVPQEPVGCEYKDFACPALHCMTSATDVFGGTCTVNVAGVVDDLRRSCPKEAPAEIAIAADLCSRHSGVMEDCEREIVCLWLEETEQCGPNPAVSLRKKAKPAFAGLDEYKLKQTYCEAFNSRHLVPARYTGKNKYTYSGKSFLVGGQQVSRADVAAAEAAVLDFKRNRCETAWNILPNTNLVRDETICVWKDDHCQAVDADIIDIRATCSGMSSPCVSPCSESPLTMGDGLSRTQCELDEALIFDNYENAYLLPLKWLRGAKSSCSYYGNLFGSADSCKIDYDHFEPNTSERLAPTCFRSSLQPTDSGTPTTTPSVQATMLLLLILATTQLTFLC